MEIKDLELLYKYLDLVSRLAILLPAILAEFALDQDLGALSEILIHRLRTFSEVLAVEEAGDVLVLVTILDRVIYGDGEGEDWGSFLGVSEFRD